jgi:hypothetical protein
MAYNNKRNAKLFVLALVVLAVLSLLNYWGEGQRAEHRQKAEADDRARTNEYLNRRVEDKMRAYRKCMDLIHNTDTCADYGSTK